MRGSVRFCLFHRLKYTVRKARASPPFSDTVFSRTDDSHNYSCEGTKFCTFKTRQQLLVWLPMDAKKEKGGGGNATSSMFAEGYCISCFFVIVFVAYKSVFPSTFLRICVFPSTPSLQAKCNLVLYMRKSIILRNLFVTKSTLRQITSGSH